MYIIIVYGLAAGGVFAETDENINAAENTKRQNKKNFCITSLLKLVLQKLMNVYTRKA